MKKIIIIGDIHGRFIWKDIIELNPDFDKVIFLGDYHDIYENEFLNKNWHSNSIKNLKEIIEFKKQNLDKVVLILGNHDTHYMDDISTCSRFDYKNSINLKQLFRENKELFQYAYQIDNNFFCHAGITKGWMDTVELKGLKKDNSNLADVINELSKTDIGMRQLNFISVYRGGWNTHAGITWTDSEEFFNFNKVPQLHQYVGHNKVKSIYTLDLGHEAVITFCDVLGQKDLPLEKKYLILNV